MKIVTNIYHHSKGKVTELAFVGDHPIESKYMIFIEVKKVNDQYKTINVLIDDLRTEFMYCSTFREAMLKKKKWHDSEIDKLFNYFRDNS